MIGRNKIHGVPGGRHRDTKSFIHFTAESGGTGKTDPVPNNE